MTVYIPEYVYFEGEFHGNHAIAVEGGIIEAVGERQRILSESEGAAVELMETLVVVPGTVNVHNHAFQSLLRGIAADKPFLEWRDRALYRYSSQMELEDIYNGALFAFAEMMKRGVTCVCDFFYLHQFGIESDEAVIQAAKDIGIRLVLARTMYDWNGAPRGYAETVDQAAGSIRKLSAKYPYGDIVSILPAPHSLHAATPEMIVAGHALARELGTKYHIHVAEEPFEVEQTKREHKGLRTIEYLSTLGVVDESMVIVHGVWLDEREIGLLGARGGSLAYCPSSNMFLADGITNLPLMAESGVTIGLGSDGACSNNRISVFEEMRMAALLQKAATCSAMCVGHQQVFDMGTVNGGRILDLPIGLIGKGYKADFVGIDLDDLSMLPLSDNLEQMLPNIVYSMEPTAIKTVVVNGKKTVEDGRLLTVSDADVVKKVRSTISGLAMKL